jgi:hypothetical protein
MKNENMIAIEKKIELTLTADGGIYNLPTEMEKYRNNYDMRYSLSFRENSFGNYVCQTTIEELNTIIEKIEIRAARKIAANNKASYVVRGGDESEY